MMRADPLREVPQSSSGPTDATQQLNRIQADLVSTARTWAADEMGAAMAHQLNEPLTALLLYLHEIKAGKARTADGEPDPMLHLVEMALRETERVRRIIARLGHAGEVPADSEIAVMRGRDAIDAWTRSRNVNAGTQEPCGFRRFSQNILTPREREVLVLITEGASNKVGGPKLGISKRTFEVHRANIIAKVGAKNTADLVRMAMTEIW